jgi:hypothetical protein
MPYCENCGSQVSLEAKFCRNCGAKQNPTTQVATAPAQTVAPIAATQSAETSQTHVQQPSVQNVTQNSPVSQSTPSEQVIGVLVLKKPKSFGRWDSFTGVLTNEQFIVAQMTSEMIKEATMQARDQAKAEGKGFFGQWSDQLKASFGYTKKYLTMEPAAIKAETPGNFAIDNNTIREIKLKLKHIQGQDNYNKEWEIEIHSKIGKYEFKMDDNSEFVELLKKAYPDRVKLPLGYFSKTINIKI